MDYLWNQPEDRGREGPPAKAMGVSSAFTWGTRGLCRGQDTPSGHFLSLRVLLGGLAHGERNRRF